MTNYEKGEKISFGEAITRMEKGEICMSEEYNSFFKKQNGNNNLLTLDNENNWSISSVSVFRLSKLSWYTAKEAEEKFIPTKAELLGLWKCDGCDFFITMNELIPSSIADYIKEGWRPATEEDLNEFYKKVVEEIKK